MSASSVSAVLGSMCREENQKPPAPQERQVKTTHESFDDLVYFRIVVAQTRLWVRVRCLDSDSECRQERAVRR